MLIEVEEYSVQKIEICCLEAGKIEALEKLLKLLRFHTIGEIINKTVDSGYIEYKFCQYCGEKINIVKR